MEMKSAKPQLFFVRVTQGSESDHDVVSCAGKVMREGTDQDDAWFVVRSSAPTAGALRATLPVELEQRVARVQPVQHPNEGGVLSRQTSLFAVA